MTFAIISGIFFKWYKWTYLQNRNSHRCRKQTWFTRRKGGGGTNWETGIDTDTILYIKYVTNKNIVYDCTKQSVMTYTGKESKKRVDICICITDSLCCREHNIENQLYSKK